MGWSDCGRDDRGRRIGYAYAGRCDEPGCHARINRGLSYVCGGMHGGDEHGCGGYFCGAHLVAANSRAPRSAQLCRMCARRLEASERPRDARGRFTEAQCVPA